MGLLRHIQALTGYEHLHGEERQRFAVFGVSLFVFVPVLFAFSLFHLMSGNHTVALLAGGFATFNSCYLVIIVRAANKPLYYGLGLVLANFYLFYLMYRVGEWGSLALWTLLYPLLAFFMMGSKNGILLVGLSWIGLLICLVPVPLPFGPTPPAFPQIVKIRFAVTYGALTVLAYVYEFVRERISRQSRERHAALQEAHQAIEHLSITDSLTKCYNRAYFNKQIHQEMNRARRYSTSVVLLLLDIDFFKRINDEYGHSTGDRVLTAVGQSLRGCLREGVDWVCRYGGEEFVIVLPQTDMEGALVLAERIHADIANLRIPTESGPLGLTASIGISSAFLDGDTVPEIIDASDRRMYKAKKSGRNRICVDEA